MAVDPFTGFPQSRPEAVVVDIGGTLTTIHSGARVEWHGGVASAAGESGIYFPALSENLQVNRGTFLLAGNGFPDSPSLSLTNLVNTGSLEVRGSDTELKISGIYDQDGASAATRIGAGARIEFAPNSQIRDGEVVVEISSRPPKGWFVKGGRGAFGFGFMTVPPADLNGALVVDFVGDFSDLKADIGDTWELAPRDEQVTGVNASQVTFRRNGGALGDLLPAGAVLVIEQFDANGAPSPSGTYGLAVRVKPAAGFLDYFAWTDLSGLGMLGAPTSDPYQDGRGYGVLNATRYLFGLEEADGFSPPIMPSVVSNAEGRKVLLSYTRRSGADATFMPYLSEDLLNWRLAPMSLRDVLAMPGGREQVTLESFYPIVTDRLFFRIQPNLNPDNFEAGLIPETFEDLLLPSPGAMNDLDSFLADWSGQSGFPITYQAIPGRVLFFNVTGKDRSDGGGSVYGGTAADGVSRNYIYQDFSHLGTAAVHAGLLNVGERGIIRVMLLPPQDHFLPSSQVSKDGDTTVVGDGEANDPSDDPYSCRIELYRILDTE